MSAVENLRIAGVLDEIGELLELKGENPFKVRAYGRAARAVRTLGRPVRDVVAQGEITKVPGIGKAIAEKIGQMLEEGRIPLHDELASEFPPQILDLMQIPGLGPRKAAVLYQELKVGSLAELERALQEGLVRDLPGFGKKTEENLREGVQRQRAGGKRKLLSEAGEVARSLVEELAAVVERIEAAGSLRRRQETVGDLDLLCTASDPEAVMERFCAVVPEDHVLARGPTKSSIRMPGELQVDLRVVPSESFGAALQYFTGSKDHNVALRDRAVRRGLKLNEYGLFEGEVRRAGATEEEVYAALGLPWIPPELRQDGAEIEIVEASGVPELLELSQVRGNLHTHSVWSDGSGTLEELAREGRRHGWEYLAVTDHSRALAVANGLTPQRLREQGAAIGRVDVAGIALLRGTECDILADGSMDFPDDVLEELDIVVASVHSAFHLGRDEMTARVLRALENPHVDVLGHPSGRILGRREGYDLDWEEVMRTAARTRTALEINCFPYRLDLRDVQCRRARDLGVRLSLGTDAHGLPQLSFMEFGVGVARRGWLGPGDVLNTLTLEELRTWLRSRS